jgi:hypothetical protein
MRPVLIIENLRNLHDARYCAAVGISMVSFEMDPSLPGSLSAATVKEITDWLSGVDGIGKFGHVAAVEILAAAQVAGLSAVLVPGDYDRAELEKLPAPVILDCRQRAWSPEVYGSLRALSDSFPGSLFLLGPEPDMIPTLASAPTFLRRCILQLEDPNATYQQLKAIDLQPYGFSLGRFAMDADGQIDYDACDVFLEQFQTLVPA